MELKCIVYPKAAFLAAVSILSGKIQAGNAIEISLPYAEFCSYVYGMSSLTHPSKHCVPRRDSSCTESSCAPKPDGCWSKTTEVRGGDIGDEGNKG